MRDQLYDDRFYGPFMLYHSTAYDQYLDNDYFRSGGTVVTLYHTHEMLHSPASIIAGKTGTTDDAGQCLLSVVETGGRRYGVVFLRSSDRYADMRRMLAILQS
jgi:D-alanyl-D-alanine carboxypeptidase